MSENLVSLADADVALGEAREEVKTAIGSLDTVMRKFADVTLEIDKARDTIKVLEKDHAELDSELEKMSIERDIWKEKFEKLWGALPKEQQVAIHLMGTLAMNP